MGLFIDNILSNKALQVTLAGVGGGITGILATDMSVEGTSEWGSSAGSFDELLSSAASTGIAVNNQLGPGLDPRFAMKSVQVQTFMSYFQDWKGSNPLALSVSILVVNVDGASPVAQLKDGFGAVFPEGVFNFGKLGRLVTAPLGYKRGSVPPLSLEVGSWFSSGPVFIMDSYSIVVSKEVDMKGVPLYATGQANLRAAGLLTAGDVAGMFIG